MFRLRFSFVYPIHGSPCWSCFCAAVKSQCGKKYLGSLALNLEVYVDVLIYLLTAVGLTPGGSNTGTQKKNKQVQSTTVLLKM